MSFRGELLSVGHVGNANMQVFRVHPHPKERHPSNVHAGKYIISLFNGERYSYVHCSTPQEIVNALHQPWDDGSYNFTELSRQVFAGLVSCEPENFKNTIK